MFRPSGSDMPPLIVALIGFDTTTHAIGNNMRLIVEHSSSMPPVIAASRERPRLILPSTAWVWWRREQCPTGVPGRAFGFFTI